MLELRIPTLADMPLRQAWLADPVTMAYNAPWFPPSGCLPFPQENWQDWLADWTNHEPERFVALLVRDGETVGEVSWHDHGRDMGVLILAAYRGQGLGAQGLRLLAERAFEHAGLTELRVQFELERESARRTYARAGFSEIDVKDGLLTMRLTREAYLASRRGPHSPKGSAHFACAPCR